MTAAVQFATNGGAAAASRQASFTVTPAVGSGVLVLAAKIVNGDASLGDVTCSDNQGNTYSLDMDEPSLDNGGHTSAMAAFSAVANTSGGTFTVTVSDIDAQLVQIYIVNVSSPGVGIVSDVNQTATGASGHGDTGVSASTTAPDEVSLAMTDGRFISSATPGLGYTTMGTFSRNSGNNTINAAYKVLTEIGTQQETWTFGSTTFEWAAILHTWKFRMPLFQMSSAQ